MVNPYDFLVLPIVEGLSVMEVKTNSAYIHWKKTNLKKFETQEMKYHVCTYFLCFCSVFYFYFFILNITHVH